MGGWGVRVQRGIFYEIRYQEHQHCGGEQVTWGQYHVDWGHHIIARIRVKPVLGICETRIQQT